MYCPDRGNQMTLTLYTHILLMCFMLSWHRRPQTGTQVYVYDRAVCYHNTYMYDANLAEDA